MDVYTDGACLGNPGPGGWAWLVPGGESDSGGERQTTNQRMELYAVLRALETFDGELRVHSDSAYVVNCYNQKWWVGWERKGWRTASGTPVANLDLWRPVIDHFKVRKGLVFVKVKGHSGDTYNEMADALANSAARRMAQAK